MKLTLDRQICVFVWGWSKNKNIRIRRTSLSLCELSFSGMGVKVDWLRKVSVLSQVVKFYEWERSTFRCDICPHLPLTSRKSPRPNTTTSRYLCTVVKTTTRHPGRSKWAIKTGSVCMQSSGAVWKSNSLSWAPVLMSLTVSVDVKQH